MWKANIFFWWLGWNTGPARTVMLTGFKTTNQFQHKWLIALEICVSSMASSGRSQNWLLNWVLQPLGSTDNLYMAPLASICIIIHAVFAVVDCWWDAAGWAGDWTRWSPKKVNFQRKTGGQMRHETENSRGHITALFISHISHPDKIQGQFNMPFFLFVFLHIDT